MHENVVLSRGVQDHSFSHQLIYKGAPIADLYLMGNQNIQLGPKKIQGGWGLFYLNVPIEIYSTCDFPGESQTPVFLGANTKWSW